MVRNESDITQLLQEWSGGDDSALDRLMPVIFSQVRELAARAMCHEPSDHTLQPTALVSEVYLRLTGSQTVQWQSRGQLFGFLSILMRRILIEHARRRRALKRGGGVPGSKIPLEQVIDGLGVPAQDLLELDQALAALAAIDTRKHRLVMLKHFLGLTNQETATVLGASVKTVERDWRAARAWLQRELTRGMTADTGR